MKHIRTCICGVLAAVLTLSGGFFAACSNETDVSPPNHLETPLPDTGTDNGQTPDGEAPSTPTPNPEPTPTPTPTPTPEPEPEQKPEPEPEPETAYAEYIRCIGDNVNIRAGAGTSYAVLGAAEKNTTYAVIGKTGDWYKTYYRGKTAYISASYTAVLSLEKSENKQIETVLEEGYKLIGVPYVYGAVRLHDGNGHFLSGFTTQKFDCSSLVQYIFYKGANKLLQVTTRTQVVQGKAVKRANIQRGDCLYFTNESRYHLTGINRVGHVAVYLGNNYILHTATDYARIEKMTAARWNYFLEARRFI